MAEVSKTDPVRVIGERSTSLWTPDGQQPEPAAPAASPYSKGTVIGDKYRLQRQLGTGGMGTVWAAHNQTLDIDVAIKVIRGESTSSDSAGRLLREARVAARLQDPAIVRVFDFGKTERGDPFIVMELLVGEDLADLLDQRGRVSAHKAVRIILPIIQALTTAHTAGVVHRDLKPENIFLAKGAGEKLQPKLVDFGIAKFDVQINNRLTHTGALLGSPIYMSPEQARGDDVDYRADIWAICVVLYEAMTGRAPFSGRNYNAVLYSIIADRPAPITDMGVGDAELWRIIEKGMAKNPDERWQSTEQLGSALAKWLLDQEMFDDITGVSLQASWVTLNAGSTLPDEPGELPPRPRNSEPRIEAEPVVHAEVDKEWFKDPWFAAAGIAALVVIGAGIWGFSRERPGDGTADTTSPLSVESRPALADDELPTEHLVPKPSPAQPSFREPADEGTPSSPAAGEARGTEVLPAPSATAPAASSAKPEPAKAASRKRPRSGPSSQSAGFKNPFQ